MNQGAWYRRLSVQLIALLTVVLLPLGSSALYQNNRMAAEADRTTGIASLGLTERAARGEQLLIERAVGAARLLGSLAPELLGNRDGCFKNLSGFVNDNPEYSFIGFLPLSGLVECSSVPQPLDFSAYPNFASVMEAQEPTIVVNPRSPSTAQSVFIVSEPFELNGVFAGFVSVSIPHSGLPETSDQLEKLGLEELITFNEEGIILTSRSTFEQAATEMPAGAMLSGFPIGESQTFRADNMQGVERRYSIVPIEDSPAAVLAVWSVGGGAISRTAQFAAPVIFPVLMWVASMGVAMLAMNTLVLRHLRRIRKKMDAFAASRETRQATKKEILIPSEIESLEENFTQMTEDIMRDEASLEDALREKGVLVKEIHHRVKNNLQLISSIMNMQIRSAEHQETKAVLRRIQDRVLSLATIHRDLYQSQEGGRINVGTLVREIVDKSAELVALEGETLHVSTDIESVMLFPDQAVPLSLLVAEATTNAMKYIGDTTTVAPIMDVRLTQIGDNCQLVIANSIGQSTKQESTGLGRKLMSAFAMQMGGKIETTQSGDLYTLTLRFKAQAFQPDVQDY